MFGSEGMRIRGKVFAFVGFAGGLVVKIPEARADEVEATGIATRMEMRGRPAREWVVVQTSAAEHWAPLTAEAFAYVDEITPEGQRQGAGVSPARSTMTAICVLLRTPSFRRACWM